MPFIYFYLFYLLCAKASLSLSDSKASLFETWFIRAFLFTPAEKVYAGDTHTAEECSSPSSIRSVLLVSIKYLPAVKQLPLAAPNVEKATKRGTIHDMG